MCVDAAGDAEQGGSAAAERRSVDGALCEGDGSAGGGKLTDDAQQSRDITGVSLSINASPPVRDPLVIRLMIRPSPSSLLLSVSSAGASYGEQGGEREGGENPGAQSVRGQDDSPAGRWTACAGLTISKLTPEVDVVFLRCHV